MLPRTAFLAKGAKGFRQWLFAHNSLRRLDFLLNKKSWAFTIHPQYTIALLTGQRRTPTEQATFQVTGPSAQLKEFLAATHGPGVSIPVSSLGRAHVVPLLPSQRHADLLTKLRRGVQFDSLHNPKISKNEKGHAASSHAVPHRELDETKQRALFAHSEGVPVWKGRSFDQYEPHGNDPAGYAVWNEVLTFSQKKRRRSPVFKRMFPADFLADPRTHPMNHCRIAFRDVTNRTNSRTVIACLVPPQIPLTNKAPYLIFNKWSVLAQASVLGIMNSLSFDWIARRYVETNLNYFILDILTFPAPDNIPWGRIGRLAARLSCVDDRFVKFAEEAGVQCGPLTDMQRSGMQAELDALVARAYELNEDELQFIFTDFTDKAVNTSYRNEVSEKFESL